MQQETQRLQKEEQVRKENEEAYIQTLLSGEFPSSNPALGLLSDSAGSPYYFPSRTQISLALPQSGADASTAQPHFGPPVTNANTGGTPTIKAAVHTANVSSGQSEIAPAQTQTGKF